MRCCIVLTARSRVSLRRIFFGQLSPDRRHVPGVNRLGLYIYSPLPPEAPKGAKLLPKHLPLPERPAHASVSLTFVDSIRRMLAMLGDRRDAVELMGISTFAFRMKLSDKTTFADGIYMFDWRTTLQQLVKTIDQ